MFFAQYTITATRHIVEKGKPVTLATLNYGFAHPCPEVTRRMAYRRLLTDASAEFYSESSLSNTQRDNMAFIRTLRILGKLKIMELSDSAPCLLDGKWNDGSTNGRSPISNGLATVDIQVNGNFNLSGYGINADRVLMAYGIGPSRNYYYFDKWTHYGYNMENLPDCVVNPNK